MAELLGTAPVRMPGAVDRVTVAQKDIDRETSARRGVHVGAERALRRRIPLHPVADLALIGQSLFDRSVGDDDEAGVVVVQELQSSELRGETRAPATLPIRAARPHVVIDDELRAAFEQLDQTDGPVRPGQGVVG